MAKEPGHLSGRIHRRLKLLFRQFTDHRVHEAVVARSESSPVTAVGSATILERLMESAAGPQAFKPLSSAIGLQLAT